MRCSSGRRWIWLLAIVTLTGGVAVGLWATRPREKKLLELAKPVLRGSEDWTWLTDDKLLLLTTEQNGNHVWLNDGGHDWQGRVALYDRKTRLRTELPGLTKLLNRPEISPWEAPRKFVLSPGGTWLSWINRRTGDGYPFPGAAHLDGTHYREWDRDKMEKNFFSDDRHLVQRTGDRGFLVIVRDLLDAKNDRKYPDASSQARAVLTPEFARRPIDVELESWLAPQGIAVYRSEDILRRLFSYRYPKLPVPQPLHCYSLLLPEGAELRLASISPQHQVMLYYFRMSRTSAFRKLLHRFRPKVEMEPVVTDELWYSRVDGSGMTEIGQFPDDASDASQSKEQPWEWDVEWLPGGKQISFVYRHTLYVLPAPDVSQKDGSL